MNKITITRYATKLYNVLDTYKKKTKPKSNNRRIAKNIDSSRTSSVVLNFKNNKKPKIQYSLKYALKFDKTKLNLSKYRNGIKSERKQINKNENNIEYIYIDMINELFNYYDEKIKDLKKAIDDRNEVIRAYRNFRYGYDDVDDDVYDKQTNKIQN